MKAITTRVETCNGRAHDRSRPPPKASARQKASEAFKYLAAVQTAKNMGAIVRAFDVRPVCKEQVESMGATFLEVDIDEDGSGAGGYAKEMSDEYKAAQAKMMLEQAADVDVIIVSKYLRLG